MKKHLHRCLAMILAAGICVSAANYKDVFAQATTQNTQETQEVQNTENKSPIRVHPFLRPFSRDSKDAPTNSAPTSAVHDVTFTSQGTYLFFEWLIFSTVRYYYFPILLQRWTGYLQLPALIS